MTTEPIHAIRRWSGNIDDETPLCGRTSHAARIQRTVSYATVTCPDCLDELATETAVRIADAIRSAVYGPRS